VHPVLAQIGPFTLYTYTVLSDAGLAVALAALYFQAPAGKAWRWLDLGLAATVGGFVGARLVYVSVNADYYLPHIDEVVQVWQGGLSWLGAPAGALLGAWLYARRRREALWPVLDALALPFGLLSLLGWSGCLAAGCAYGFPVAAGQLPAWFVSQLPDLFGLVMPRFPTQALGIAWSIVALLALWGTRRGPATRWPTGALGAYALSLAALGVFGLSFTRGDPAPLMAGYRIDVVGSALVLVAATVAWMVRLARGAPAGASQPPAGPAAKAAPSPEPPAASAATANSIADS
jgi:phosphatidylglycerol---prolipoprotein diacylglyceryl transferase